LTSGSIRAGACGGSGIPASLELYQATGEVPLPAGLIEIQTAKCIFYIMRRKTSEDNKPAYRTARTPIGFLKKNSGLIPGHSIRLRPGICLMR
jgi:hypothetical protein